MEYLENINKFIWSDLLLRELNVDGENIIIKIIEKDNQIKTIKCEDFIGIKYLGKWEQSIIDSITVERTGDVVIESMFKVKHHYDDPFINLITKNDFNPWVQLNIKLVDGCFVKIACKHTYLV